MTIPSNAGRPAIVSLAVLVLALACEAPVVAHDPSSAITPLQLPVVELETTAGRRKLGDFEQPTLLHFWATWCAPCRRELPRLGRLAQEAQNVRVVAVSDEPWSALEAHFSPGPVPPWIARDSAGELAHTLGVGPLPDTYLIDVTGVARRRVAGSIDWTSPPIRTWVDSISSGDLPR